MKLTRSTIIASIALVFLSGIVLGSFGQRLYTASEVSAKSTRNSEDFRRTYLAEMEGRLHLTEDQIVKLNSILDDTRTRFREARERMRPELLEIRSEQQDKVRAMLNPDQQPEYDKMRQERAEREKQTGGGPGF